MVLKRVRSSSSVDTSDFPAKKDFIALKTETDKLDINKLFNATTSQSNLKTNTDDLDVGKMKIVPVDLKKLSDVVDNEVVKNSTLTKFNTSKAKVNSLGKKISDATTLIHINKYNTNIQYLEKNIENVENKIRDGSSLVTAPVLNAKISDVGSKIPTHDKYITTPEFNMLTAEKFAAKLKQANLMTKTDFNNKLININKKTTSNKTKHVEAEKKTN